MAWILESYKLAALVLTAILALLACGGPPAMDSADADSALSVPGESLPGSYIVTFRDRGSLGRRLNYSSYFAEYRDHYLPLAERFLADPRIKDIQFLTSIDLSDSRDNSWAEELGAPPLLKLAWGQSTGQAIIGSIARVDFVGETEAQQLLNKWDNEGEIWFAEPNYVSRLSQTEEPSSTNLFENYASEYDKLSYWWLNAINITRAYQAIAERDVTQPGVPSDEQLAANRPIIAVLDSGVDYEHPALKERIWVNPDINTASCDNDTHGCNTTVSTRGKLGNGEVWPYDTSGPGQSCAGKDNNCSHGTHVAGIIIGDHSWSGSELSQQPAAGICPVCQVMVLKIVSKVGNESGILDSSIIAAFKYIALFRRDGSPVRIINASFGKFVRSRAVGLLIRVMKEKRGTLLVAAAGNEDTLTKEYPAAFKDAIAVAAVDSRLHKVAFSNFGRWVDISAPGSAIISTVPGGATATKSGTSMATPMVAGVAGLLVARHPQISFDALRTAIITGADPSFYSRESEGGFNYQYYYPKVPQDDVRQPLLGSGLLNAASAVNLESTTGLPVYGELNRVKRGCGVVETGRETGRGGGSHLLALFLALAFVPLLVLRQRNIR